MAVDRGLCGKTNDKAGLVKVSAQIASARVTPELAIYLNCAFNMTELDAKRTKIEASDEESSSPVIDDMFAEDDAPMGEKKSIQNIANCPDNIDDLEGYYSSRPLFGFNS
jgi:hypothetical protein